jgi:CarboxypepD_reg-like domain
MNMTNKMSWIFLIVLIAAGLLTHGGCDGSATQTTNGGLHDGEMGGVLVDREGRPVADAKVQIWAAGSISPGVPGQTSIDPPEAITDHLGRYKISHLASGEYNIFGEQGSGAATVLIPAIIMVNSGLDLGVDTLKPPGKIVGKAITSEGPLEGAFCYLPGSSYISISDEDGSFALDRVPEGTYRLKYAAAGYSTVTDTIEVISGEVLALPPQRIGPDISVQPPIPQGLWAEYDTAGGIITLGWSSVQVSDLLDYILYLHEDGKEPIKQGSLGMDTVLVDSTYRLHFLPGWPWENQDTGTFVFVIKARDKEGNLSRRFSDPVTVRMTRPPVYRGTFHVSPEGAYDSSSCRDTLQLRVGFNGFVPGEFRGDILVKRKLDTVFSEEIYRETLSPFQLGDTAVLNWFYGKTTEVPIFHERYPNREIFNASEFTLFLTLLGPAEWAQIFRIDVKPTSQGCFLLGPSRLE